MLYRYSDAHCKSIHLGETVLATYDGDRPSNTRIFDLEVVSYIASTSDTGSSGATTRLTAALRTLHR